MSDNLAPLMRQYQDIKRAHQDAILLFRVGDFYEMFYEDAKTASKLLSIALTSRDKDRPDPVPLCGVPYHAVTGYIAKLLKAGQKVALCDQVDGSASAKGLVRREVTRLYTPGTLVETELLPPTKSNFLIAVTASHAHEQLSWGLATLEPSTGEFWVMERSDASALASLRDELYRLDPRELLYPTTVAPTIEPIFSATGTLRLCPQESSVFDYDRAVQLLQEHFRIASLDGFGCRGLMLGIQAAGAVLQYLQDTQPSAGLSHVSHLQIRHPGEAMHLDCATIRNLELIKPLADHGPNATLLKVLDHTVSAMGGRLLRDWILHPLTLPGPINARLDAVAEFLGDLEIRTAVRAALKSIQDLPRLSSRISLGVATPRELQVLKESIASLPQLSGMLTALQAPLVRELAHSWDDLQDVFRIIDESLLPDAPASARDGGIIRDGYHTEIDDLRRACREGKSWIARLEVQERIQTGIETLKVRFNQVFGYYIEVTKANAGRIPDRYIRKQTLVNAERFTTPELQELEDRVAGADVKSTMLEREVFAGIRARVAQETARIQAMGKTLAVLDVLTALAETAATNRYSRPTVDESSLIRITEGRHPVVEQVQAMGFIPNETLLDLDTNRVVILTGPNMAGKSTYLRQVALIALMAHMGSFVPAREAQIGIIDRIFTRVGASDNLAGGQSTFMVEMIETAEILNCATRRSLILLDEIGRGTSTYDGLSIAWAVAEHIQDRSRMGARTLFATHYHEMTELARYHDGVKNYTVQVKERNDEVLFLRKIVPGGADRSYGIHVARLAGLPQTVIDRARAVLAQLESQTAEPAAAGLEAAGKPNESLPPSHAILEEVRQMDLFAMTPLEALNRLADLQRRLEEPK
jgi:DNA mismatch repair protein MutS